MKQTEKTRKELRNFGLVMTAPLLLIGGYLWWKDSAADVYVLAAATFFLLSGMLVPEILRPVERVWMKFAEVMSVVMTFVILTLTFFLIITPYGLLLRLMGRDLLQTKLQRSTASYWVAVDPDGPASRPGKPY